MLLPESKASHEPLGMVQSTLQAQRWQVQMPDGRLMRAFQRTHLQQELQQNICWLK